jgi:hypothetical protein
MGANSLNYSLPDTLTEMSCVMNNLTHLPPLSNNLIYLSCDHNKIIYLPILPEKLKKLSFSGNKLTYISTLPENLTKLFCDDNILISLPPLSKNLIDLTHIPNLPENLTNFDFDNNIIYDIVNSADLNIVKRNINTINNFKHLYHCIKFRAQFRKYLWEKVREPKIIKKYDPNYLIEHLDDTTDLDEVLDEW